MYVTGNANTAWALDARTARPIWSYRRNLPANYSESVCCGPVNRGFGILGDRLYMGTLDAHLVALDRKTGKVIWDVAVGDPKNANAVRWRRSSSKTKSSSASFTATSQVVVHRRYDAESGERAWRIYTIPAAGQPGSETWPNEGDCPSRGRCRVGDRQLRSALNLSISPETEPRLLRDDGGDNLYTCSLVALDADTGTLRWHYQFTPHDTHDWDSSHVPVLADLTLGGQAHKVVMVANRNGFFYVLDRESGKFLLGKPFTAQYELGARLAPTAGRSCSTRSAKQTPVFRKTTGAPNFQPSFDPAGARPDGARDLRHMGTETADTPIAMGRRAERRAHAGRGRDRHAVLRAIDPTTGERRWEHRYRAYPSTVALALTGGIMTTASGLLFTGDNEGYFYAFDATSGKELWRFQVGAPVWGGAPISFLLDGRQWVVTPAGLTLTAFALPQTSRSQ
jgi:alcohol dehydrogenase (cytochrome c)